MDDLFAGGGDEDVALLVDQLLVFVERLRAREALDGAVLLEEWRFASI